MTLLYYFFTLLLNITQNIKGTRKNFCRDCIKFKEWQHNIKGPRKEDDESKPSWATCQDPMDAEEKKVKRSGRRQRKEEGKK